MRGRVYGSGSYNGRMTFDDLKLMLEPNNFQPFRIILNSGQSYEVRHSEFAVLTERGAIYLFKPSDEQEAYTAKDVLAVIAVHNISSIEPIGQAA